MSEKERIEKVVTSVPVDSTAARVTSRGVRYESSKKITQRHWDTAPPHTLPKLNAKDLLMVGYRFGRMTVVGKLEHVNNKGALWLVRCDCSHFESRRTKAIRNPRNVGDCCDRCRQLIYAKRTQHWRSTGEHVPGLDI